MSTILDATKDLGNRFRLVGLLSTAALGLFVLALLASGAPGQSPQLGRLAARAASLSAAEGVLLAVSLIVLALVAQPLQLPLVRLLEGYWGASIIGRVLAAPGKGFHRARRNRLNRRQQRPADEATGRMAQREAAARKLRRYPPAAAVLPTALGNALRSAELRAGDRYGLDTVVAWPRLYPLLSGKLAGVVDDLRDQLDIAARLCAVFVLATGVGVGLLAPQGWWLTVPASTAVLAWLCYRSAIISAVSYGEALEAAFDLHRFDLLTALHLPLPADLANEINANEQLTRFLRAPQEEVFRLRQTGHGINFRYQHDPPDPGTPAPQPANQSEPSG